MRESPSWVAATVERKNHHRTLWTTESSRKQPTSRYNHNRDRKQRPLQRKVSVTTARMRE